MRDPHMTSGAPLVFFLTAAFASWQRSRDLVLAATIHAKAQGLTLALYLHIAGIRHQSTSSGNVVWVFEIRSPICRLYIARP